MIQKGTKLKVSDNSGAKIVECIHIKKDSTSSLGKTLLISVKQLRKQRKKFSKVKKGGIYRALILRSKEGIKRFNGFNIKFGDNAVTLLPRIKKDGTNIGQDLKKPFATRILGPTSKELRILGYNRVITLSSYII